MEEVMTQQKMVKKEFKQNMLRNLIILLTIMMEMWLLL